jgi:predicted ATPase/DNA-binding SARP family transcriptional activator
VDRLELTLLGTFEVRRGGDVLAVPGARLRGLLVRLALAGGRPVDPAALTGALWPDEQPADPVNALQSLVSRLRRILGRPGALAQVEGGYRLDVAPADVDALHFERRAADGRERLRAGDTAAAADMFGEALARWGEPAAIAAVAPAWATRLAAEAVEARAGLAEAELALGQPAAAAGRLTALLAAHPADERVAALLMDALAAQGRQAEALAVYEQVREQLADQLGADPGTALRERHLRLLRTPEPAPATDAPSNLPAALTSFIGRDDEFTRLDVLLAAGRLVTVVGPGGAGKTRLALEAGRRHRHEYRDGTWLIDLASVTEPAKVAAAVLAGIGLRGSALFETANRMRAEGGESAVLADQLNGRETLLVVDNCEHLIDAVAQLIAGLLPRCAGLRVLATSREPLAVDGEALVPLGPLPLPGPTDTAEQARRTASVRLFVERAAAVRPGFDADESTIGEIRQIVRGLDGMPLALELAAARLRTLSLTELAAGLPDRFRLLNTGSRTAQPRHRTLRAVIAWSWDLLGEHERTVAERVSVLPGGVNPASAAAVCAGTAVPAADVPELLAALVDRSLLQLAPDAGRYRMLETLREYGIERLAEQGTLDAVRDLAARHLARLVIRHEPLLRGPGQFAALGVLRAEYDNVLAALRYLCDIGDARRAVRLAVRLSWYWQMLGRDADATYWLGRALALPGGRPSLERDCAEAVLLINRITSRSTLSAEAVKGSEAELRSVADRLLAQPNLPGVAAALAAVTLAFLDEVDAALVLIGRLVDGPDPWLAGLARMFRAQFAENQGDLDQARADVTAALDCFGRAGDRWGLVSALPMRALVRQYDGDLDGALADLREARALARDFGSLNLTDEVFIDLRGIDLYMRQGDGERALAAAAHARELAQRAGRSELAVLVGALEAAVWARLGDLDRAQELIEEAEVALVPHGGDHGQAVVSGVRALICLEQRDAAGAEAAVTRAYAAGVASGDMPIVSMVAVNAAGLAQLRGQHREVAQLLGAAARLRGTHDRSDPRIREMAGRSRAALGEDVFAEAYELGWQLDGKTASTRVDPARLRRELDGGPAQARRA